MNILPSASSISWTVQTFGCDSAAAALASRSKRLRISASWIKEATKDPDYAHGYTGHTRYLQQYIRLSKERQIELFRQAEPYLSLYEQVPVITDQNKRITKLEEKLEKYQMLDKLIENIEQPKLEKLLQNLSKN